MAAKGSVFVIGSGAAGQGAARTLARSGWDVTVADSGITGGTCLWRGCMPKKALFVAANRRRDVLGAARFGLAASDGAFDWSAVLEFRREAQATYAGDQAAILAGAGATLIREPARFTGPGTIECGGVRYTPDHVVIATGSRPFVPQVPGVELADTSDDALEYPAVPESLLIVGGGFIAMEFAGIYAGFGSRVTVMSREPLPLRGFDQDTTAVAVARLEKQGVRFFGGCTVDSFSGARGDVEAAFTDETGSSRTERFTRVLYATGRVPALDDLGLENALIERDDHGRLVLDRYLRTTDPRVWAVGDAAGGMMQTPVASYEGRTVARSIDSGTPVLPECRTVPVTCYTDPELAQVGMTEDAAQSAGIDYRVGKTAFEFLGAAVISGDRDGLVKLLFSNDDDRLIGAHIAAPHASDLIYALAAGLASGITAAQLRCALGIHPAFCEAINWAAS